MEERINYARVVEMIVYCPDWREKEQILRRVITRLVELERIKQMDDELSKNEADYDEEEIQAAG